MSAVLGGVLLAVRVAAVLLGVVALLAAVLLLLPVGLDIRWDRKNDLAVKFCAGPLRFPVYPRPQKKAAKSKAKPKEKPKAKNKPERKAASPEPGRPRRRQRKTKTKTQALRRHSRIPHNRGRPPRRLPRQRPSRMRAAFWGRRARWQRRSGPGGRRF